MNSDKANQKILVISQNPELAEITRKAVSNALSVDHAQTAMEGLDKARQNHPDIVILGKLETPETMLDLYRELKEGWITRHSSLIVVERITEADSHRILSDENLGVGIGEYEFLTGATSPLFPSELLLPRLREIINKKLFDRANKLRASILNEGSFCLTWEQIPGLGAFEIRQELVLENARAAARGGRICSISIVDNPGGNPAIATEILCSEIKKLGIEPMFHLAFRDRSRNQVESLLYQLAALNINNLLVLTGDYPSNNGFTGTSRPVFDLDSVNGMQLVQEMNQGMEHEIMRRKTRLAPTDFFAGVAFSPFKQQEAEVMGQYYKMKKKIEAGAKFAITQIGYDVRKWQELLMWLKAKQYQLPVLTSIQVLSLTAAKAMRANRVPGAVVTEKLLQEIAKESESPDKGRKARLDRAAKMYAISRGMGFKGTCISGQGLNYENIEYILDKGKELTPKWVDLVHEFDYPQENGFYYFEKDPQTGLNSDRPTFRTQRSARPVIFLLSRAVHTSIFEPESPLFKPVQSVMKLISKSNTAEKVFGSVEFWSKAALYGCKDCGDCALFDVAYLCPISQCPKDQRNAPCGGSFEGWCEVYPGKKQCIWVRAYRRLKSQHKEDAIGEYIVPPCNWELWQTSSWLNYFLGKDHVSRRIGIKPPVKPT